MCTSISLFQSAPRSFDRSVRAQVWELSDMDAFQSAPRSFDRSVSPAPAAMSRALMFQSAPRSFDRSVYWRLHAAIRAAKFQSAPWSFDRSVVNRDATASTKLLFQSAPRSFDRSVSRCCPLLDLTSRFNPHPGPSTGVSAPSISNGAPRKFQSGSFAECQLHQLSKFQSAPRSFDRSVSGMRRTNRYTSRFNPHPGPSTGVPTLAAVRRWVVSIRTPVLRPECLEDRGSRTCCRWCFNPHPGPSTGVSWRWTFPTAHPEARFQSAPRSFDRSVDRPGSHGRSVVSRVVSIRTPVLRPECRQRGRSARSRPSCFNPHPGPSTGVSGAGSARSPGGACFNPHPGPSTGVSGFGSVHASFQSSKLFQSAPRSFDRSVGGYPMASGNDPVSIRTPVLRPECQESAKWRPRRRFQSAPRSFDRSVL